MIDGLATDTIVASTRIMKKPTIMAQSACHGSVRGADAAADRPRNAAVISPPRLGLTRWCRLTRPDATAFGLFLGTSQSHDPCDRPGRTTVTADYPMRPDATGRRRPRQLRAFGQRLIGCRLRGVVPGGDADGEKCEKRHERAGGHHRGQRQLV